jgi:hypothetical protein
MTLRLRFIIVSSHKFVPVRLKITRDKAPQIPESTMISEETSNYAYHARCDSKRGITRDKMLLLSTLRRADVTTSDDDMASDFEEIRSRALDYTRN